MDIQFISRASYAVYIGEEELTQRGICPASVTKEQLEPILSPIFEHSSGSFEKNVYFELYPGKNDVLVFIRFASGRTEFFSFQDFEILLTAVKECSDTLPAELINLENTYILAISPWEGDAIPASLFEFGEKLPYPPAYLYHLREHGNIIIKNYAIGRLKQLFPDRLPT